MNKLNLIGEKFGRLTVLSELSERTANGKVRWLCKCDCGNEISVIASNLKSGHTKSCNCIQREHAKHLDTSTHRKSRTSTYNIWQTMKSRCLNPKNQNYKYYGAIGIVVCDRWLDSFENFLFDMGEKLGENYSIDRIDVTKGYSKDNCRWATKIEQENNKRNNISITYNGKTHTLKEWSRILNINYHTLRNRINKGFSINKAFTTPVNKRE